MKQFLYNIIEIISQIHTFILVLNDKYEYNLFDKTLHFLVIGVLGLILVFIIHPIFKLLSKSGHVMIITLIYVFTLILGITFAIEIGQNITNTGTMEFADIVYGVVGFLYMFIIFQLFRFAYHCLLRIKKTRFSKKGSNHERS